MSIRCDKCGREYDATLFQYGRVIECECGSLVTLSGMHVLPERAAATRMVLVRHGETDWNKEGRIQGHQPTHLNEQGRREARLVAPRVAAETPGHLYSSDLPRAMETAEAAAALTGLHIVPAPELREAFFGEWEGKTFREVQAELPGDFANWVESDFHKAPPGGESAAQLRERVIAFIGEVFTRHPNETSVLFTHGGPCKYAVAHVLGLSPDGIYRYTVSNAAVTIIEIGVYGWRLITLNDTCHLKEGIGL